MKKIILWLMGVCILISSCNFTALADENAIKVTLDSKVLKMDTAPCYNNEILMVPVVEMLEKVGAFVKWDAVNHEYIGNRKGIDFSIPLDKSEAVFDSVTLELDAETQNINNIAMMDVRFIDCIQGINTEIKDNTLAVTINKQKDIEYEEWSWNKIAPTLPEGEEVVTPDLFLSKYTISRGDEWMTAKIVDIDGMHFKKAVELETMQLPVNNYDTKIDVEPTNDIRKGDVAVLTFYARKLVATHESGNAFTEAIVEQTFGGYAKSLIRQVSLTDEWQQFAVPLYDTVKDLQLGKFDLNFRVGYKPQTIQIADVHLINYKGDVSPSVIAPDAVVVSYKGMEKDALWREEALRRIEKYRKNDMNISVVDSEGNPVPNAKVTAKMTRNEFIWGTAADAWLLGKTGDDAVYGRLVSKYFNEITPESNQKWPLIERNKAGIAARLANWAIDNNMYMRGHNLVWDSASGLPENVIHAINNGTEEDVRKLVLSHIVEMVRLFGDSVCQWDVLNEPSFNNLMRTKYGYDFAAEWFKAAKYALDGKDVKLYVNEMEIKGDKKSDAPRIEQLIDIVENLKAAGAPIDGIGIEDHCVSPIYPQDFYNQLDEMAEHVNEIAVTEYDLKTTEREIGSDFMRDEMIVAYSHPKCTGFIMWGFTDKYHWLNNAPLLDASFSPKPALEKYIQTIDQFTTNEQGSTDNSGNYAFRGFRGEYDVTVSIDGHSQTVKCCLKKDEPNTVVCVYDGKNISMVPSSVPKTREKINMRKFLIERAAYQDYDFSELSGPENLTVTAFDGTQTSALTDNLYNTFWSFNNNGSFVTVENPMTSDNPNLTLSWNFGHPYQYSVYVSDDNITWEQAEKTENENQFAVKNHKWIKIINESNRQISLSEIDLR